MMSSTGSLLGFLTLCVLLLATGAVDVDANGKTYRVEFDTGNVLDWDSAQASCGAGETLAVFDSREEYKMFREELLTQISGTSYDGKYWLGIKKAIGDPYMRGAQEGAVTGFSNFYKESVSNTAAEEMCISMDFLRDPGSDIKGEFKNSLMEAEDCDDSNPGYICMDTAERECNEPEDLCNGATATRKVDEEICLWNPYPYKPFTFLMGYKMCAAGKGHFVDLLDATDITRLEGMSLVDPKQSWNQYWTGLLQKPGQGAPRWSNGYITDEDIWEDGIHYGSSLNTVPYAGIYHAKDKKLNLYMVAPFVEVADASVDDMNDGWRQNREAFVVCEAKKADFCVAYSPDLANADKDSPCCDKLVYSCKPGFVFADGDVSKEFDCTCDVEKLKYLRVMDCIVKDPCWDGSVTCGRHSVCTFTNEIQRPYKCKCKPGYQKNSYGDCDDIDECSGDNPCGSYYGKCINTQGSYSCQCTKGYGWDNSGKCSIIDSVGTNKMTLYFSVIMDYSADMNDPSSPVYASIKTALDDLIRSIYGNRVVVESFVITNDGQGKLKIKLVLILYTKVDITELSSLAWKFYQRTSTGATFRVGTNTYPYVRGVYLSAPGLGEQISITSLCSVYEQSNYCHNSYCEADYDYPVCVCREGYTGKNCADPLHAGGPLRDSPLTRAEIGLVAAVALLFLLVICMPLCICCCWCGRRRNRSEPHYHHQEPYTQGVYQVPQKFPPARAAFHRPVFKMLRGY